MPLSSRESERTGHFFHQVRYALGCFSTCPRQILANTGLKMQNPSQDGGSKFIGRMGRGKGPTIRKAAGHILSSHPHWSNRRERERVSDGKVD